MSHEFLRYGDVAGEARNVRAALEEGLEEGRGR